jgi:hypothetical protein
MKKVKLTEAEFNTEKDSGQDKHTLREALAHDAGLPIIARIEDQIGPRYDGPLVEGYPWGSSLWSHGITLNESGELELHITAEDADRLDANRKTDVKANILAKVKNAENKLVASAEPIESEATRGNRK